MVLNNQVLNLNETYVKHSKLSMLSGNIIKTSKEIKMTIVGSGYVGMSLAVLLPQHNNRYVP